MHGRKRNGEEYRDQWVEAAEHHGVLLAAPEFGEERYPHAHEYNYGSMIEADGTARSRSQWLFPAIDEVFREVRRRADPRASATRSMAIRPEASSCTASPPSRGRPSWSAR